MPIASRKKNIEDVSVPENVRKMFIAVNSSGQKARIFDLSKVKVFPLRPNAAILTIGQILLFKPGLGWS